MILALLRELSPELAKQFENAPCPWWRKIEKDGIPVEFCIASAMDGFLSTVACEHAKLTDTIQGLRNERHAALLELDRLAGVHGVPKVVAALASAGLVAAIGARKDPLKALECSQAGRASSGSKNTAPAEVEALRSARGSLEPAQGAGATQGTAI